MSRPPLLQPLHHLLPYRHSTPPAATAAAAVLQVCSKGVQQLLLPADLLLQPVGRKTHAAARSHIEQILVSMHEYMHSLCCDTRIN
jgi:hypothetical protein